MHLGNHKQAEEIYNIQLVQPTESDFTSENIKCRKGWVGKPTSERLTFKFPRLLL